MKAEIPAGFHFDAKTHRYYLDGKQMTGCTTILGVLNKPALVPWAANMAVDYINHAVLEKMKLTSFEELVDGWDNLMEEARTAHARKRDDAAQKGTDTHALVEEYINDCIKQYQGHPIETIHPEIGAFEQWAKKEDVRFLASEQKVYSKSLFVAGTYDFMFEKDGKRYLGDLKTYKRIHDRTPLIQCAGYAIMYEEMKADQHDFRDAEGRRADGEILPDERISGYCVVNLPKDRPFNEEADVVWAYDPEADKEGFLACVKLYRLLENFKPVNIWKLNK